MLPAPNAPRTPTSWEKLTSWVTYSAVLTTDKGILRKMTQDQRIRVLDPIAFLSEYRGTDDENGS